MQILLVEDDAEAAQHVSNGLRDAGYTVDQCGDGAAGLAAARAGEIVARSRAFGLVVLATAWSGAVKWAA